MRGKPQKFRIPRLAKCQTLDRKTGRDRATILMQFIAHVLLLSNCKN